MRQLSIDLETYSSVDLKKSGLHRYVQSPDFEILLMAYCVDGGAVELIDFTQGEEIPEYIIKLLYDQYTIKQAYNAAFEWACLSKYLFNLRHIDMINWLPEWQCTMAHGLYCGYPAGLAGVGEALGLPQDKQKMTAGSSLIKTFCVPCKPTARNGQRTRNYPQHEPEKWEVFKEYCKQDVSTEMEVARRLSAFPMPENEKELWVLDQKINLLGVKVDKSLVDSAIAVSEQITAELSAEAVSLTGLENPNSVSQLSEWYKKETGKPLDNLRKETVEQLLAEGNEKENVKRALEIRQELAKTSVSKYTAIDLTAGTDERVRGLLQYYGANRTGRWAGRLVQIQNLPRNYLDTLDHARECVKQLKIDELKQVYGNVPDTLSQLIRTAFIPDEGKIFIVADFSAIEARIVAWLAREQWVMDVFASHGKIYEATAAQMFDVPIERIVKGNPEYELRQKGKVATLALGYGGGEGSLISLGALNMGLTEDELPGIVSLWRSANKKIRGLWYLFENAALSVMRTCQPETVNGITMARESDGQGREFLTILLPSGRKLYYARPAILTDKFGKDAVHYYSVNAANKWTATSTWGGKLVENVVQAIARDCLAVSLQRLDLMGCKIVFHVHDEIVVEISADNAERKKDIICAVMGVPISWAPGLILKADGFTCGYYKKD